MTETDLLQHLIDMCTSEVYIQGFGWYQKQIDGYMVQLSDHEIKQELVNLHFKDDQTLYKTAEISHKKICSAEKLFEILRSREAHDIFGKYFFKGQDTQGIEHLSKITIQLEACDTTPCLNAVSDWYEQNPKLLQQVGGYILFSPDNRFQKVFLVHGPSGNGKGTFLRVLTSILEQHVEGERLSLAVNFDEFSPSERVGLVGKQLVYDAELSGSPRAVRWLKLISGGDKLTARALYKSQITFLPTCKVLLLSNPIPDWQNSPALIRRLVLLNFKKTFAINPVYEHSLMTEDMLKRWVWFFYEGYQHLCKFGFLLTEENNANEFLSQADNLSLFLQECCEFGADLTVPTASFYKAFKAFWEELEDKRPALNKREVGKRLREYGIEKHRNVKFTEEQLKQYDLLKDALVMKKINGKLVQHTKTRWDMYHGIGLKDG